MKKILSQLNHHITEIREASEHVKTLWIYGISVTCMIVVIGFWLVYSDYRLPAVAPPKTTDTVLVRAAPQEVGAFAVIGKGFSYIASGITDRVTRGLALVKDQFVHTTTFSITPQQLPPLERGVLPR